MPQRKQPVHRKIHATGFRQLIYFICPSHTAHTLYFIYSGPGNMLWHFSVHPLLSHSHLRGAGWPNTAAFDACRLRREFWCPLYRVFGGLPIAQCFGVSQTSSDAWIDNQDTWGGCWGPWLYRVYHSNRIFRFSVVEILFFCQLGWMANHCNQKIRLCGNLDH